MNPDYWGYGTERLPGCSIPICHTFKFLKGMHIIDADLCVDFMTSRWLRRDHRRMAEGVITTKPFLAGVFDEIDIYDTTHDHLFTIGHPAQDYLKIKIGVQKIQEKHVK